MPVGGDMTEVSYNNPTVGSGFFFCKAAEDSEIDFGGVRNNDDANGVDGAGNMIRSMSRVRWSVPFIISWDMTGDSEMEKLIALAKSTDPTDFTFGNLNGASYKGTGTLVGDIKGSTLNATIPLTASGGGELIRL